jgi:hypothetical protein
MIRVRHRRTINFRIGTRSLWKINFFVVVSRNELGLPHFDEYYTAKIERRGLTVPVRWDAADVLSFLGLGKARGS